MDNTGRRSSSTSDANKNFSGEKYEQITRQTVKEDSEDSYLPDEPEFVLAICLVRIICFLGWTGGILYSTYQIYLAAEEFLYWQNDPIMNGGPFTQFLDRGRDTSDYEWTIFTGVFFTKIIYWYAVYVVIVGVWGSSYPKMLNKVSISMSILVLWLIIGWQPVALIIAQPVSYWLLMRLRSKLLIWGYTIAILLSINSNLVKTIVGNSEESQYYYVVVVAWNCARCISYSFDIWERPRNEINSTNSLYAAISYCFYFPLTLTGPLILFDSFEKHIHLRQPQQVPKQVAKTKIMLLVENLTRLVLITILNEILLHYLYFRPLALSIPVLKDVNLWVICGLIFWLGQFFSLKYKVMYGIPTYVAEFEGADMPPLPRCPAYLHRYSVLWKDFDRGLYYFLVRYTYLPVIRFFDSHEWTKVWNTDIKKLIASFASFCYIYLWHSTAFDVLVWAGLNFLGITIERIGSFIKRKVDAQQRVAPIVWDFIIEPMVTIPLAAMSILNSSVFCGSLESAQAFTARLWSLRKENYALVFIYCFTHLAVTLRTWDQFSTSLRKKHKQT